MCVCRGNVGIVYLAIGEQVFSPHVNIEVDRAWFGGMKTFPATNDLLTALAPGVPIDVKPGGNLTPELAYGIRRSASSHSDTIREDVICCVIYGRALVFDRGFAEENFGLLGLPLGVVEGNSAPLMTSPPNHRGVRASTKTLIFPGRLRASWDVLLRVMYSRHEFGPNVRIVLGKLHVKSLFLQIPVDRSRAPVFG